jgi:DNA-binding transcriptional LysR family regulator
VLAHRTSRTVRLTDAGHELANALPAALRQLERTLAATRAVAEGGWEI